MLLTSVLLLHLFAPDPTPAGLAPAGASTPSGFAPAAAAAPGGIAAPAIAVPATAAPPTSTPASAPATAEASPAAGAPYAVEESLGDPGPGGLGRPPHRAAARPARNPGTAGHLCAGAPARVPLAERAGTHLRATGATDRPAAAGPALDATALQTFRC
jgi:hypothetical protein